MSGNRSDWQVVGDLLGEGGQSKVYRVRGPERLNARNKDNERICAFSPWGVVRADTHAKLTGEFADAVVDYGRAESFSEFGALKEFKFRDDEEQAISRLKQEVQILGEGRPGLPRLLDFNLNERWMVTEYFPNSTLENNYSKYEGDVRRALTAFLSLVTTVAALHANGIIHRDIKPANVFVGQENRLILGDFGIVFLPDQPARLTRTKETVGPHDYMPPWAEAGGRLPKQGPVGLRLWINGSDSANVPVYPFVCDSCGHVEFFTRPAARPGASGSED